MQCCKACLKFFYQKYRNWKENNCNVIHISSFIFFRQSKQPLWIPDIFKAHDLEKVPSHTKKSIPWKAVKLKRKNEKQIHGREEYRKYNFML